MGTDVVRQVPSREYVSWALKQSWVSGVFEVETGVFLWHEGTLWCQDTAQWILGLRTGWRSQVDPSCGRRETPGCLPASEGSVRGGSCQGGSETELEEETWRCVGQKQSYQCVQVELSSLHWLAWIKFAFREDGRKGIGSARKRAWHKVRTGKWQRCEI